MYDGHPVVIPTLQVRVDDHLYLHASSGSRLGLQAGEPWPVSVSVTLYDGLVLARPAGCDPQDWESRTGR
ncbi:MAG: pyridoxamine 5'-phosphate oxidase family protein [Euzebya sp.]